MLKKIGIFAYILLGAALGVISTFYSAGLFILLLFLGSLFFIKVFVKTESSDFLIKLFLISFILRALFCLVNYNVGLHPAFGGGDTQPDAAAYNVNAFYVSYLLKGNVEELDLATARDPFLGKHFERTRRVHDNKLPYVGEYQFGNNVYMQGILYAWLGYAPVAAKMINSLFCCMSIVVVYLISRQLFKEERPSRYSALIFAFFPSIFYWSITGLRDSLFNFFILGYLLCMVKFIIKKNYLYALFALLFVYLSQTFRISTSMPLLAGLGAVLIINTLAVIKAKNYPVSKIALFLGIFLAVNFIVLYQTAITAKIVEMANSLARIKISIDIEYLSRTNYRIYSDLAYQQGGLTAGDVFSFAYVATIFKAILYFFFSPFPFGNWTLNFLPFYPQIIYWYLMAPFAIKGWLVFLKKDKYTALVLAVLLLIIILPVALYETNAGTAFRHKDMFIPVAFIFAAYAFTRKKTGKAY